MKPLFLNTSRVFLRGLPSTQLKPFSGISSAPTSQTLPLFLPIIWYLKRQEVTHFISIKLSYSRMVIYLPRLPGCLQNAGL